MKGEEKEKEKVIPPDHLRCKRTDGRQWQCTQHVMENKTLCERHLLRGRSRQYKKKVREALFDWRRGTTDRRQWRIGASVLGKKKSFEHNFLRSCQGHSKEKDGGGLPEHLRCNRTDGKQWRCNRKVMDGKKLCEIHYLQGRHRQHRVKVPESLKIQRGSNKEQKIHNLEVRAHKIEKSAKFRVAESAQLIAVSEALDDALRKMKLKKGNLQLELIRMVLMREVEKRRRRNSEESSEGEMTRSLPNGQMAISPALSLSHFNIVGSSCDVKIGEELVAMPRRCFRSKNIEPLPIATLQVVPYVPNGAYMRRGQRKAWNCCQRNGVESSIRPSDMCEEDNMARPSCHGTCICGACLARQPEDMVSKEFLWEKRKVENILSFHYLICKLLPVLQQIHKEHSIESDTEARTNGTDMTESGGFGYASLSLNSTKEMEIRAEEIVCSYDIPEHSDISSCCSLCLDINHNVNTMKDLQEAASREDSDDNFLYHPTVLESHRDNLEHFQMHWGRGHPVIVRDVLQNTSKVCWDPLLMICTYLESNNYKTDEDKEVFKAINCLDWCEIEIGIRELFIGSIRGQKHTSMWENMLKMKGWLSSHLFEEQFPAHYEEIIHALPFQEYMNPKSGLLNLAATLPPEMPEPDIGPCLSISYGSAKKIAEDNFLTKLCYDSYDMVNILAHTTDIPISPEQFTRIRKLMDKHNGKDEESAKSTIAQGMETNGWDKSSLKCENIEGSRILNGIGEEMQINKRVTKFPHSHAAVPYTCAASTEDGNLCQHGEEDPESDTSILSCTNSLSMETLKDQGRQMVGCSCFDERIPAESCGAEWDVFRRQDVPKLIEYLRRHSDELGGLQNHMVHPILDQNFFLDATHKMRLKEEFDIEPWTFEQHVGEAVIIPSGCPYQIRNFKSCVNVVLEFVSPENATECIQLIDELHLLPEGHKARVDKLEVRKMVLYGIGAATEQIRDLTCSK